MIYAKTCGMAVIAMAALMALGGSASATQLTSPTGAAYTGTLHATSEGHMVYQGPLGIKAECNNTLTASIEQHGVGLTSKGKVTEFSYANCTSGISVTVLKTGVMEIHSIAGTNNGTVTSSGAEIDVFFPQIGIRCIYTTNNTHIGTLTGSNATGGTAVVDVAATLLRTGGSAFCGQSIAWSGKLKITTPDNLLVDA